MDELIEEYSEDEDDYLNEKEGESVKGKLRKALLIAKEKAKKKAYKLSNLRIKHDPESVFSIKKPNQKENPNTKVLMDERNRQLLKADDIETRLSIGSGKRWKRQDKKNE